MPVAVHPAFHHLSGGLVPHGDVFGGRVGVAGVPHAVEWGATVSSGVAEVVVGGHVRTVLSGRLVQPIVPLQWGTAGGGAFRVGQRDHFLLQRELELALQQRHPNRFVPHYTMVTFMRTPYAVALERSEIQRTILVEATRGRRDLSGIDWDELAQVVQARLPELEDAR